MHVIESKSKAQKRVSVRALDPADFRKIKKHQYFFNWKSAAKEAIVYKLTLNGEEGILGLIALVDVPSEFRIEIKLLATSIENTGKSKIYEGIAGCLISFACREAVTKYGELAAVSLLPKTELKHHYMKKYGMLDAGRHVYLEGRELIDLIKKYS
jgi:hypothetical protein